MNDNTNVIETIVREIILRCNAANYPCSEFLAAFIARTTIRSDPSHFPLLTSTPSSSAPPSPSDVDDVVTRSVALILRSDDPRLETIKMQVRFESSRLGCERWIRETRDETTRERRAAMTRLVTTSMPRREGTADYEFLTRLHGDIFRHVATTSVVLRGGAGGREVPKDVRRSIEREVASAVDSVLPVIALKCFVFLNAEEKKYQIEELSRIVLGIRLFNKTTGKGGAGIKNTDEMCYEKASHLLDVLGTEIEMTSRKCDQYRGAISIISKRKKVTKRDENIDRLKDELANRRQYLIFMKNIKNDADRLVHELSELREAYESAMDDLQTFVGNRTSIPKEYIYPKFEMIAKLWRDICEEWDVIESYFDRLHALLEFKDNFTKTLDSIDLTPGPNADQNETTTMSDNDTIPEDDKYDHDDNMYHFKENDDDGNRDDQSPNTTTTTTTTSNLTLTSEPTTTTDNTITFPPSHSSSTTSPPRPIKITISPTHHGHHHQQQHIGNAYDVAYNGHCPHAIVRSGGLLLPCRYELGLVAYDGRRYGFRDDEALRDFIRDPAFYVGGVIDAATRNPSLIHLLGLDREPMFKEVSLEMLVPSTTRRTTTTAGGMDNGSNDGGGGMEGSGATSSSIEKKDASTETPTHFVETFVDRDYEWNEWDLRRKALARVDARRAKTISLQTDGLTMT